MVVRINTQWCEFTQKNLENLDKPTLREIFQWIFETLGGKIISLEKKLHGIQSEPNGVYLKLNDIIG